MDFPTIYGKVVDCAAPMLADPKITTEDAVSIAAALMAVAKQIFITVGGSELAANQFYAVADQCVEPHQPDA